jgi:hypothetical protein
MARALTSLLMATFSLVSMFMGRRKATDSTDGQMVTLTVEPLLRVRKMGKGFGKSQV